MIDGPEAPRKTPPRCARDESYKSDSLISERLANLVAMFNLLSQRHPMNSPILSRKLVLKMGIQGALVLAVALPALGQSTESRRTARQAKLEAAAPSSATFGALPQAMQGRYIAVANCRNTDIWLDVDLGADGQAQLQPQAQPMQGQRVNQNLWPTGSWQAGYDAGGQWMRLSSGQTGRGLTLELVSATEAGQWTGAVRGRGWESCGPVLMLRGDEVQALKDEFPSPRPDQLRGVAKRLPLGSWLLRATQRSQCDRETLAWVNQYLDRLEALGPRPKAGDVRRATVSMFSGKVFDRAFGKSLKDVSLDEARNLSSVISSSPACGMTGDRRSMAGSYLQWLTYPLLDNGSLSRFNVATELRSIRVFNVWSDGLNARVAAWETADPAQLDLGLLDGASAALVAFSAEVNDPDAGARQADALVASLTTMRQRGGVLQASMALIAEAASVQPELDALQRLALSLQVGRGRPGVNDEARAAVAQRINALLPTAAEVWANRATGLEGWQQLASWGQTYAALLNLAGSEARADSHAAVDGRQRMVGEAIVQAWRQEYQAAVANLPWGEPALLASTALEARLQAQPAGLTGLPSASDFAAERAARRARDLDAALPALKVMVASAPNLSALNALRVRYLVPGDSHTSAVQALSLAISTRQAAVAPFANLPAGDYLNALYSGDHQRLRELDRQFVAPYKANMLPAIQHIAPLLNLMAGVRGGQGGYAAAAERAFDSASMIAPMFAIYLIDYAGRLGQCLEPDAVSFKITTTSETVFRNGYGTYKYSVRHPDQVEHFKVNRRFARVFERVGTAKPDSMLVQMLDRSFGSQGRVTANDLVAGTRELMRRLDSEGCGSPLMQRMEANMLAYFDVYQSSNAGLLDAMYGPR